MGSWLRPSIDDDVEQWVRGYVARVRAVVVVALLVTVAGFVLLLTHLVAPSVGNTLMFAGLCGVLLGGLILWWERDRTTG